MHLVGIKRSRVPLDGVWIRDAVDVEVKSQHFGVKTDVHPVGPLVADEALRGPSWARHLGRDGTEPRAGRLTGLGQVLAGVLAGDPTLSVRGDQAVETWRIVEPVLQAWRDNAVPLEDYEAGSDGPTVPLGAG
jgi:hypothetical protein